MYSLLLCAHSPLDKIVFFCNLDVLQLNPIKLVIPKPCPETSGLRWSMKNIKKSGTVQVDTYSPPSCMPSAKRNPSSVDNKLSDGRNKQRKASDKKRNYTEARHDGNNKTQPYKVLYPFQVGFILNYFKGKIIYYVK